MMRKLFKRFTKVLKEKRGYTLIEVAAVVAVTAILAAVVIPVAMDKIEKSKEATAKNDVKALAVAVGSFFADTGKWPAHDGASFDKLYLLRTGASKDSDPDNLATLWTFTEGIHDDIAQYHLVIDAPMVGTSGNTQYAAWKGPYTASLADKKDPWGKNYLIWVKAMHTAGNEYGWIISAGPDGTLDTDVSDPGTSGDDIGIALYSKR